MKSQTLKRKTCVYCGKSFELFPKDEKSRVTGVLVSFNVYLKEYYRQVKGRVRKV